MCTQSRPGTNISAMSVSVERRLCLHHHGRCQLHKLVSDTEFRSGAVDTALLASAAKASADASAGFAAEPHWLTEMNALPTPPWWRDDLPVGACASTPPVLTGRWGDCDTGDAGSFRLHAPMRQTTKRAQTRTEREFRSAAIACDWLCQQCGRCRYVSFARRSPQECIWRHTCGGYPNALDGNIRYRTAQVHPGGETAPTTTTRAVDAQLAPPAASGVEESRRAHRRLIFVTASYPHDAQLTKLQKCAEAIRGALAATNRILWVLSEDAATPTPAAGQLLAALAMERPSPNRGVATHHLAVGPTRSKGHAQRSAAFRWLREQGIGGVVYNLDDDNEYHPALWPALLQLRPGRVGVLPVGFPTYAHDPMGGEVAIEGPVYAPGGRLKGFSAGWCSESFYKFQYGPRFFCIDMGGFAFDASLLQHVVGVPWNYAGRRKRGGNSNVTEWRGGESEFVEQLLPLGYPEDLQPLANCAHDVLVMHNAMDFPTSHTRAHAMHPHEQRFVCRDHGW